MTIRRTPASVDVPDGLPVLGAGVHLRGNVSPEIVLDDLAIAWPRPLDLGAGTRRPAANQATSRP